MKTLLIGLLAATALATSAQAQPAQPHAGHGPAPAPARAGPAAAPAAPAARAPVARVDADPALWVVRDADTTVYLFGTFHVLDAGREWFNDEVRTAFDASAELVLEADLPENPAALQPLIMRLAIDPQGRTVSSRLNAAQNAALQQQLGPMAAAFDQARFEPWFVTLALTQTAAGRLGLNPENGPETVLKRAARARNIPLVPLETAEFQLGILDGVSEADQLESLREVLDDPDQLQRLLRPMLQAWSTGDTDRLAALLTEEVRDNPASYAAIFTNRNANWARWIRERMARPGTVFMAVGAGHLGGPGSVQDQLRGMNIRAARVPAPARVPARARSRSPAR